MKKNIIHEKLKSLEGYLISIKRNVETSNYELEVGFRKDWVFKSTKDVDCVVVNETENGKLVTVSGKHDETTIDDLISYVDKVIETNKKITEMQKRFESELEKKKKELEEEIYKFQEQLDEYKDSSLSDDDETSEDEEKNEIEIEDLAQKVS